MTELMKNKVDPRKIFEETEHMPYYDGVGVSRFNAFRDEYVEWLEAKFDEMKLQLTDQTLEKFQEIIRNQCDEISALKAQLTWRPVSEKPEKDGIYLIRRVYLDAELMLYRGGKWWFFDDELFQYLEFDFDIMANKFKPTHWLPIPPAQEGE